MNDVFAIDDRQVVAMMQRLTPKGMEADNRRALAASSMVLVRATRLRLKSVTSRASSTRTADRRGWSRMTGKKRLTSLSDGVRFRVVGGSVSRINILGDFRLKFFESGAGMKSGRRKRNGASTGVMRPRPFFGIAFNAVRKQMHDALAASLSKSIERASR